MISYKGYYIKNHLSFPSLFFIVTEGQGGRIPAKMKGLFTSVGVAKELINTYTHNRDKVKEKPHASKARAKSGD